MDQIVQKITKILSEKSLCRTQMSDCLLSKFLFILGCSISKIRYVVNLPGLNFHFSIKSSEHLLLLVSLLSIVTRRRTRRKKKKMKSLKTMKKVCKVTMEKQVIVTKVLISSCSNSSNLTNSIG